MSEFIGRAAEFAALENLRRSLAHSHGGIVLMSGEMGIGKSRLLEQFVRSARSGRQRNVTFHRCLPSVGGTLALPDDLVPASLLSDAAKRATIVAVDDLQWADSGTLRALQSLALHIERSRLMVVATYRTEDFAANSALGGLIAAVRRNRAGELMALEPLSTQETRSLLRALSRGKHITDGVVEQIVQRSEGNPFFAEELLKEALESKERKGRCPLSTSLRERILELTAGFTPLERRIVTFASVLGSGFDPALLAAVLECDVDAVLPALRKAVELRLIDEDDSRQLHYHFHRELIREALYDDELVLQVRRAHARVLQHMETQAESAERPQELAHHARAAGDARKAALYSERAAEAALAAKAPLDAARFLERALEAAADDDDRLRLSERAGTIAHEQGDFTRAIDLLETALAIRLKRADYNDAARLVIWIASDRANRGDAETVAYIERFLLRYGDRMNQSAHDSLAVLAARLASANYSFADADRLLRVVFAPTALEPRARQNYLIVQLNLCAYRGDIDMWRSVLRDFDDVFPDLEPFLQVGASYTIAQTGAAIGANPEVEAALENAALIEREHEFSALQSFGAGVRAFYLYLRGRLEQARQQILRVPSNPETFVAWPLVGSIGPFIAAALGDESLAKRCVREGVVGQAWENMRDIDATLLFGARGTWLLSRGRFEEGRADLRLAVRMLSTISAESGDLLVNAAIHLGDEDLPKIEALLGGTSISNEAGPVAAHCALVSAILGKRRSVSANESEALRAAERYHDLGWPMFEARALEISGRVPEAVALYDRCGALAEVQRLGSTGRSGMDAPVYAPALSAREREIARLVRLGLGNAQIGERLGIGTKTVEKHLSSIFGKLGLRSRSQLAALVAREEAPG